MEFGAHDDTGNGIYHGNSFESKEKLLDSKATARLSHVFCLNNFHHFQQIVFLFFLKNDFPIM
jgi:hypothetical protein